MRIGFFHSIMRPEEKLLLDEFEKRNADIEKIDVRKLFVSVDEGKAFISNTETEYKEVNIDFDLVYDRCLSHSKALSALKFLESNGIKCLNCFDVASTCSSKFFTSLALKKAGLSIPETSLGFEKIAAFGAMKKIGFPVVLKPDIGSWGRLLAKINDMDAAEALLEYKQTLGGFSHSMFYLQDFIEKDGRDIRSFVVGDEVICAIYRNSEHWITNTARGGKAVNCPVNDEIRELSLNAARSIGYGIMAIDLFETRDGKYYVNEVNHSMEFRNTSVASGVNVAEKVVDFVMDYAKK